jgi:hypothetical protein
MKRTMMMVVAAAWAMTASGPARAATIGGEVFGAFNTYSMEQFNDFVLFTNSDVGTNFEEISTGFGGGLALRVWPTSSWMVSAGWEPLFASTKSDAFGGDIEINLDAHAFQATGAYFFPSQGPGKYGLGAGLGYYTIAGEAPDSTGTTTIEIGGSAVGFHFLGLAEWTVSPGFAVTASGGYRVAKIDETEFDGVKDPDSETDYSGLMLRGGLAFYLPTK